MSILEILEAHKLVIIGPLEKVVDRKDWRAECIGCEWSVPYADERHHHHRAHVAQVLEQHEREANAEAWEEGYDAGQGDGHTGITENNINPYANGERP